MERSFRKAEDDAPWEQTLTPSVIGKSLYIVIFIYLSRNVWRIFYVYSLNHQYKVIVLIYSGKLCFFGVKVTDIFDVVFRYFFFLPLVHDMMFIKLFIFNIFSMPRFILNLYLNGINTRFLWKLYNNIVS